MVTLAEGIVTPHSISRAPPFTPLIAAALAALVFGALRDSRVRAIALLTAGYLVVFTLLYEDDGARLWAA